MVISRVWSIDSEMEVVMVIVVGLSGARDWYWDELNATYSTGGQTGELGCCQASKNGCGEDRELHVGALDFNICSYRNIVAH